MHRLNEKKGEIANKANVKEIRLHDFKHSCASLLVNNKAPLLLFHLSWDIVIPQRLLKPIHIYLKVH